MPRLNAIKRLRMILSLLEKGEVADLSVYDGVEMFDKDKTVKYVEAVANGQFIGGKELTNGQKAKQVLQQMKQLLRSALQQKKIEEACQAAAIAANAEVDADFVDDVEEEAEE